MKAILLHAEKKKKETQPHVLMVRFGTRNTKFAHSLTAHCNKQTGECFLAPRRLNSTILIQILIPDWTTMVWCLDILFFRRFGQLLWIADWSTP